MRFSIHDDDAREKARAFYNDLARGAPIEEALLQAQLTLAEKSSRLWAVGVPVLYTSLAAPVSGFMRKEGMPSVIEYQPRMEVSALPHAEGGFHGRSEDLKLLGALLTSDNRPRVLTIHGGGGQGKTALARETVEHFAYAWPGGVWATTLENLPDRAIFATNLARFLGINTQEIGDPDEVERQIHARLVLQRTLIVLDNAETLVDAVEANNAAAIQLGQFLQQLPSTSVSLLVTSRVQLGWAGEVTHELGGLSPQEGTNLFRQCAPQPSSEIDGIMAWGLSEKLEGHPLSLRLLGSAFNACGVSLDIFLQEHQKHLMEAENKYRDLEHRHRSLYACIDTSVRYLNSDLRNLLSGLCIFHAPFLPETAVAIFDPDTQETEQAPSIVRNHLHTLWQRSLLTRRIITVRDGTLLFYYLLPTTRPYVEEYMQSPSPRETLLARFGAQYAHIARFAHDELNRSAAAVVIAQQTEVDLDRAVAYVTGVEQGYYQVYWAGILHRLGAPQRSLKLLEPVLESAQGQEQQLTSYALNNMAEMYRTIGQPQRALSLYEQALPILREVGDRTGEGAVLNNMAAVYQAIGQPQRALSLYEQALPILREVGNRTREGAILTNIAGVYQASGQPQRALSLYEQALPILREVGDRTAEGTTLNNMALLYWGIGQPERALSLYEQALPIRREVSDHAGEGTTLTNMAAVYQASGQPQRALSLYEQALPILREVGDRAGEGAILNNMAEAYRTLGWPERALSLYEQALPIRREVSDHAGEGTTLTNIAGVYQAIGQPERALSLYEQALPILREVSDRTGEGAILNNMAEVYRTLGQPERALSLYEQALPILRKAGNRAGEGATLTNMALLSQRIGQPERALSLYEQALPIRREVGNRAGEGTTLNNMATVYQNIGQPERALSLYEQALSISREVGDRPGEGVVLVGLSFVLYEQLNRTQEAIHYMEQAIDVLERTGLPHDAAGHTPEQVRQWLQEMRSGTSLAPQTSSPATMPTEEVQ